MLYHPHRFASYNSQVVLMRVLPILLDAQSHHVNDHHDMQIIDLPLCRRQTFSVLWKPYSGPLERVEE